MALTFFPDADQPLSLPLGNDPDTLEASGEDNAAMYLFTGDQKYLTIPEGATWVTVRALTTEEMRLAAKRAGIAPALGAIIGDRLQERVEEARDAATPEVLTPEEKQIAGDWLAGDKDPKAPGAALAEKLGAAVGAAEKEVRAEFLDALTPDEREAFQEYQEWETRRESEMVALGWCGATGGGWDTVPQDKLLYTLNHLVFPLSSRERVREELMMHIRRLSVLPPEGKA